MATAAYVHIPFCRQRCYYCDFPVVADARADSPWRLRYLQALGQEIRLTPVVGGPLQSVYFGGGTPSLLTPQELAVLLETLAQRFGLAKGAEISLEADPGTPGIQYLRDYRQLGVNRLSLGVQSFVPALLQRSGRTHTVADIAVAIEQLHRLDWENWNLDLLQGLPGQTLADWQYSLTQAVQARPRHVSTYDLTLEPKTRFYRDVQRGQLALPPEELTVQMYVIAHEFFTRHGYGHYEISNYAQPGYACRHNLTYWRNQPYYGFGLGATSYLQGVRFSRPATLSGYLQWVERQAQAGGVYIQGPSVTPVEVCFERLMLGLRLHEGVDLMELLADLPPSVQAALVQTLQRYRDQGWVDCQGDRWFLVPPQGFLMANTVLVELWQAMEQGLSAAAPASSRR
ncbi:MAG: radical SAM family heme chaperone HemW [Gloeomargarita sp. GMQP_bins_120]